MEPPMPPRPFTVAIPIYDGVDLLDMTAPREVFRWLRDEVADTLTVQSYLAAASDAPVTTRDGTRIVPDCLLEHVPSPDVMWVPGGEPDALVREMGNGRFMDQLRAWAVGATYVCSVCEGAMLLDAAGLLDGHRATTHWAFIDCLKQNPAITVVGHEGHYPRYVIDPDPPRPGQIGIRVTGGGVSSGLDEVLKLVELIAGTDVAESVQRSIQYMPKPPVHARLPAPECNMPSDWNPSAHP
jgi:cyclohexyl-isocyanide hydratase